MPDSLIALSGELDLSVVPALHRQLAAVCRRGTPVVVDFADVTFVDCLVLGLLVGGAKRCWAAGQRLLVVNAAGRPARLLELTGLTSLLVGGDYTRLTGAGRPARMGVPTP